MAASRKRKSRSKPKIGKEWEIPSNLHPQVDPLYRLRVQDKINDYCQDGDNSYGEHLERRLAIVSNFQPEIYEEISVKLIYALSLKRDLMNYVPSMLVSLDDEHLYDVNPILEEQKKREIRRLKFETLIQKLTKEEDEDGQSLLKCRKCNHSASFYPLQTRSADEPMTIFASCLNPDCKATWKW